MAILDFTTGVMKFGDVVIDRNLQSAVFDKVSLVKAPMLRNAGKLYRIRLGHTTTGGTPLVREEIAPSDSREDEQGNRSMTYRVKPGVYMACVVYMGRVIQRYIGVKSNGTPLMFQSVESAHAYLAKTTTRDLDAELAEAKAKKSQNDAQSLVEAQAFNASHGLQNLVGSVKDVLKAERIRSDYVRAYLDAWASRTDEEQASLEGEYASFFAYVGRCDQAKLWVEMGKTRVLYDIIRAACN